MCAMKTILFNFSSAPTQSHDEPLIKNSDKNIYFFDFIRTVFGNKKNNSINNNSSNSNRYLIKPQFTEGLMSLMDTFLLTVTCRSNIVLVSSSVEQHLGHCRVSKNLMFAAKSRTTNENIYI